MSRMEWKRLLSTQRLGQEKPEPMNPARSPFQKDMDRIIFSSSFRLLQDKTQVHSLPESDFVRTRLTHSMEVASVGRSLGTLIGDHVIKHYEVPDGCTPAEFGHIVSAACLAHDIGNPPFGHFGERSIGDWFRHNELGQQLASPLTQSQRSDLEQFEGNAQGFRILTRLQNWRDSGGLQLTCATLGAYSKYPRESFITSPPKARDVAAKKFGFCQSESALFQRVADTLGLLRRNENDIYYCRHPLAYLVEAADDTCYQVVDLEDGFKLGRVSAEETERLLKDLAGVGAHRLDEIEDASQRIAYLRAKSIGHLANLAAEAFIEHEEDILAGNFEGELLEHTSVADTLVQISEITRARVFETPDRMEMELMGSIALSTLLRTYGHAFLQMEAHEAGGSAPSQQAEVLARLFPESGLRFNDRYQWLLSIVDFVSGMTDTHLMERSRRLARIEW